MGRKRTLAAYQEPLRDKSVGGAEEGTMAVEPPLAKKEGSFEPDFEIMVKQDGLWLNWPKRHELLNLGDPQRVFEKFADAMGQADFEA